MLDRDPLDELFEARGLGDLQEPLVSLEEGGHEPPITLLEARRQRSLEPGEDRSSARRAPEQDQRIVRDTHERRREHGEQRLVVVAVLDQPQVREDVDNLLLSVVAAAYGAVGLQPLLAQGGLEHVGRSPGCQQHRDLAGSASAELDQLLDPPRQRTCLGEPPVLAALAHGRLVDHGDFDGGAKLGSGKAARRLERFEMLSELCPENVVDDSKHLGSRAVVLGQRKHAAALAPTGAEDVDVGVAKAIDRLELVADEEELAGGEEVDELALEPIRVLKLVDHDRAKAPLELIPDSRTFEQQVADE